MINTTKIKIKQKKLLITSRVIFTSINSRLKLFVLLGLNCGSVIRGAVSLRRSLASSCGIFVDRAINFVVALAKCFNA